MGKNTTIKTNKMRNQKNVEKKNEIVKPMNRSDIMNPKEVCEFLDIGIDTLYKWVERNFIPCIRIGRKKLLFNRNTISQWLYEKEIGCGYYNTK